MDWAKITAYVILGAVIMLLYKIWDNYKKKRDRDLGKPLDP